MEQSTEPEHVLKNVTMELFNTMIAILGVVQVMINYSFNKNCTHICIYVQSHMHYSLYYMDLFNVLSEVK